jgi:hypothetical protein
MNAHTTAQTVHKNDTGRLGLCAARQRQEDRLDWSDKCWDSGLPNRGRLSKAVRFRPGAPRGVPDRARCGSHGNPPKNHNSRETLFALRRRPSYRVEREQANMRIAYQPHRRSRRVGTAVAIGSSAEAQPLARVVGDPAHRPAWRSNPAAIPSCGANRGPVTGPRKK